ncbi:MAG: SgcJ/EcaC family oxidoreductase, partial [Parcubacteria group bacterium]
NSMETEKNIEAIAESNFSTWNDQLLTKESQKVAQVYLPDGELFGTVSSKIRKGREEIREYFDHFLKIDPSGKVIERNIIQFSEDCYLDEGFYDFNVIRNGKEEVVHARFIYIWKKDDNGDWKILHHHSYAKSEENKKLSDFRLNLKDIDNIQWGTNKEVVGGFLLQTGFYEREDGKTIRFSCVSKGELVSGHFSECPEDHGV